MQIHMTGVGVGWAEWAIVHPGVGRSVNQRGQIVPPISILAHPALGNFLRP